APFRRARSRRAPSERRRRRGYASFPYLRSQQERGFVERRRCVRLPPPRPARYHPRCAETPERPARAWTPARPVDPARGPLERISTRKSAAFRGLERGTRRVIPSSTTSSPHTFAREPSTLRRKVIMRCKLLSIAVLGASSLLALGCSGTVKQTATDDSATLDV